MARDWRWHGGQGRGGQGRTSPAPWTGAVLAVALVAMVVVVLVAPLGGGGSSGPATVEVETALPPPAQAPAPLPPAALSASPEAGCVLNVRAGPASDAPLLATLNCTSTVGCVAPAPHPGVCAPVVLGEPYRCEGSPGGAHDRPPDRRWAQVSWTSPSPTFVALACAEPSTPSGPAPG